jgi:hypothetical protein
MRNNFLLSMASGAIFAQTEVTGMLLDRYSGMLCVLSCSFSLVVVIYCQISCSEDDDVVVGIFSSMMN